MYQMYMPLAKQFYEDVDKKLRQKKFHNSQNEFDSEQFIDYVYGELARFTSFLTVGSEGEANIGYALLKCLKELSFPFADYLEKRLDRRYSSFMVTRKTEDFCQRYFNYGKEHVRNIIDMVERYQSSLPDVEQSVIDKKVLALLPTIKELVSAETVPSQTNQLLDKINSSALALNDLCDNLEISLKDGFVKSLNEQTQVTVDKLKDDKMQVKVMNGQDFNLIIHSSNTPEEFLENEGQGYHQMISTSLIDNQNIRAYQASNVKFAFYGQITPENLISAYSRDASTDFSEEGILSSFSTPDYLSLEGFKGKTRTGEGLSGYSEIMLSGQEISKPDAIVCYDHITEQEKELADKYHLDIILIETEHYKDMLKPDYREQSRDNEDEYA